MQAWSKRGKVDLMQPVYAVRDFQNRKLYTVQRNDDAICWT